MKQLLRKNRVALLLFFLILFNMGLSIQLYFMKREEGHKITEVLRFEDSAPEKKMIEKKHPYQLRVYYPITDYPNLNQEIDKKITNHIEEFKKIVEESNVQMNQEYNLDILYEVYGHGPYLSYVFTIFQDTGGAHPYTFYDTISYQTETGEIITMEQLVKENPSFLKIASEEVRNHLSKNPKITNYDMMIQGTLPKIENFENFAFTENGYQFFFSPYQVAPYSSGRFQVLVPYDSWK